MLEDPVPWEHPPMPIPPVSLPMPRWQVISGNYVTAKRRGVVGGVDLQFMGQVRFVQAEAINQQLQTGAIVLLTNIGVSANGELLNCNTYDVRGVGSWDHHAPVFHLRPPPTFASSTSHVRHGAPPLASAPWLCAGGHACGG